MDTSSNLNTNEATQKLKEILNIGQLKALGFTATNIGMEKGPENSDCVNGDGNHDGRYSDGNTMLESLTKAPLRTPQNLILKGGNENHSFDIYSQDVTITCSPFNYQSSGSSRVQIKNVVDYGWEQKYYSGRLVNVHVSGNYLAYAIMSRDKCNWLVRVMTSKSSSERALIKGMAGAVKDLAFAHIADQVILAIVDEIGNLYVHRIEEVDKRLSCVSILTVMQPSDMKPSDNHRVIWCQFVPEDPSEDADSSSIDASKLLVVTHNDKAEMLNVDLVTQKHGPGPVEASSLYSGYQIITDHSQPIVDASFSPDGAALATASLDGEVKFFQVYLHEESASPRCLHQWNPHNGKPLSCLFFLDNHKTPNPDVQFWKYAVTGADYNREIKVWSCESWSCLQTIRFKVLEGESADPCLKAGMDISSTYLMLSDIARKVFYVLILNQDVDQNFVQVCSIAEFPLTFPILSYAVVDASRKKYKQSVDNEHIVSEFASVTDDGPDDDTDNYVEGVVVKLFYIQPKSLQECRIAYQPKSSVQFSTASLSSLSQDSYNFRDRLSDMSFDTSVLPEFNTSIDKNNEDDAIRVTPKYSHNVSSSSVSSASQILMTPAAFASPIHNNVSSPKAMVVFPSPLAVGTPSSIPLPPITPSEEAALATPTEDGSLITSEATEPETRHSGLSGGSSPSLEVQQILASRKRSLERQKSCEDIIPEQNNTLLDFNGVEESTLNVTSLLPNLPVANLGSDITEKLASLSPFVKETSPKVRDYDSTIWPQAPSVTPVELNLKMDHQEMYPDATRKANFDMAAESGGGEPSHHSSRTLQEYGKKLDLWIESSQEYSKTIISVLQMLQKEQVDMKQELKLHHGGSLAVQQAMARHFERLEIAVANMLERSMLQLKQANSKSLEESMNGFEKHEQQRTERYLAAITQSVANNINVKLEVIVKNEMRTAVLPMLTKMVEPLKEQIQSEVAQKLTAADSLMKENISKLVKSKSVVEAIGSSTASMLQSVQPAIYKEVFQTLMLPAYERACCTMFHQLNDSFQRGTKEYVQMVEHTIERKRRQVEQTRDPALIQLQTVVDSFQSITEQLSTRIISGTKTELERQLKSEINSLQEVLLQRIHNQIRTEMENAFKEQKNAIGDSVMQAMRSGTVTPVPTVDLQVHQTQVIHLLRQGKYNAAFQQALSASDLKLVTLVCQSVPPEKLFEPPGHLQQPVLLSLIQQLSTDLFTNSDLKLRYLEEGIYNVDKKNPLTREHVGPCYERVASKLLQFIQSNPSSEHTRIAKMLYIATAN